MMAPTFCKDCSIKISGFFKKKYTCQLCFDRFCDRCFSKVKVHAGDLSYNLRKLPGQNCLPCVVLRCGRIKREQLFLLENKQLAVYLSTRQIPTERCSEKYHLVDLIMDFAEKNGIKSGDDVENECLHRDHVEELKRKAELLRLQEQRAMAEDRFESQHEETGRGEEYKNGSMNSGSSGGGEGEGGNSVDEAHYSGSTNSNSNEFNDMNDEDSEGGAYDMDDYSNNDNEGGGGGENASSQQHEQQHQQSEQHTPDNADSKSENNPSPRHQASGKWRSLEDIQMMEDINTLSVLELKQILTANFIDYRGCCEKKELQDKVTMLYESKKDLEGSNDDRDLCKICMDRMIDCIFLDCAHLVACTRCGKNLTECPICRALIVRVVHIFRA